MDVRESETVRAAVAAGEPVVALESVIVAHGLPRPANLEVALAMEGAVRAAGAVPATIAIIDGVIRVGLTVAELERLALGEARKCSLRDLAAVVAAGADGATTVAASIRIARAAGIDIFATGGIGGVMPGGGGAIDISADLMALADGGTAVVCAGAKSIMDIAATLETLETLGVPVVGYGTDQFPAFYTAESGHAVPDRVDDPAAAAAFVAAQAAIGLPASVLICNPPPAALAIDAEELSRMIERARRSATRAAIAGSALTPWLLAEIDRLSDGRASELNKALVVANAALAGQIARALNRRSADR